MIFDSNRRRANALALIASAGFAGGNLFIGLSMGAYWLSLDPLDFVAAFGPQFQRFLLTIMPLFLGTLAGLVWSARLDWARPAMRRSWIVALWLYGVTSAITMVFHMPLNLDLLAQELSAEEAARTRTWWLWGHVPRVLLSAAIPVFALRAIWTHAEDARARV